MTDLKRATDTGCSKRERKTPSCSQMERLRIFGRKEIIHSFD